MLLDPKSAANYFIDLAAKSGQSISPLKLQKLLYYAQGWYAGHTGEPLLGEAIEAWPYGPVIPSIYHEFKRFGSGPILEKARRYIGFAPKEVPTPVDSATCEFLNNVWTSYSGFSAIQLSEMTHAPGTPWEEARPQTRGMSGVDIPFEAIEAHFKALVAKANEQQVRA